MEEHYFDVESLSRAVAEASNRARLGNLAAGVPVFYLDEDDRTHIMEMPDGRKFEIRYIPGAPGDRNDEVLGQLGRSAA